MKHHLIFFIFIILTACASHAPRNEELKAELFMEFQATLGEGSLWNPETGNLWWIDIDNGFFYITDPGNKTCRKYELGKKIGTVVPAVSGKALLAMEDGFWFLDLETEELTFIQDPEAEMEAMRFNDGKCDPAGRFWAGSMSTQSPGKYRASLYRLDHDLSVHMMLDSVTTSNGICWSQDKTKMYYIDTPTRKIMVFDYDDLTGDITNARTAVDIPEGIGYPDGMTIDSQGNLWVGMWGGSAVCCWNPNTGALLRKVNVPAKNVTSCAFGGKDLRTLFITTARTGSKDEELQEYSHSGDLFAIHLDVEGVPAFFFMDL